MIATSGAKQGVYRNESDFAGATAGNILLGGIIGVGIDAATGAANKNDGDVAIILEPLAGTDAKPNTTEDPKPTKPAAPAKPSS